MVAGVGLEPHDLRVMSPTSYQLLHPAIFTRSCEYLNNIHHKSLFVNTFYAKSFDLFIIYNIYQYYSNVK